MDSYYNLARIVFGVFSKTDSEFVNCLVEDAIRLFFSKNGSATIPNAVVAYKGLEKLDKDYIIQSGDVIDLHRAHSSLLNKYTIFLGHCSNEIRVDLWLKNCWQWILYCPQCEQLLSLRDDGTEVCNECGYITPDLIELEQKKLIGKKKKL